MPLPIKVYLKDERSEENVCEIKYSDRDINNCSVLYITSRASTHQPSLSETEPKWFVFEHPDNIYAFGGRYCIESVASLK